VLELLGGANLLVAHALFASKSEVAALCAARATLAFCPLSQAQFGFLGPVEQWVAAGGGFVLGTDSVASNDTLDIQRELSLTANLAGFRTALGPEQAAFFESGDARAASVLERRRQELVGKSRLLDPGTMLSAAWGVHLPGGPRGIQSGAPANLLVLDPEHPALFPAEDLPRLLVHASIAPAIFQLLVHGSPVAEGGHFQGSLLGRDEYRSALGEAVARRQELQVRAGLT
jgi:cytosine/adenosine deaminase-related metal-dependent hydrolase